MSVKPRLQPLRRYCHDFVTDTYNGIVTLRSRESLSLLSPTTHFPYEAGNDCAKLLPLLSLNRACIPMGHFISFVIYTRLRGGTMPPTDGSIFNLNMESLQLQSYKMRRPVGNILASTTIPSFENRQFPTTFALNS